MKPIREESQTELSKIQAKILSKSVNGKAWKDIIIIYVYECDSNRGLNV